MKSFKNHYNRSRFSSLSLLKNSSFEHPSININSLLYYNSFNQLQKDALIWTGGGNIVSTPGGNICLDILYFRFYVSTSISIWISMHRSTINFIYTTIHFSKLRYVQNFIHVCFKIREQSGSHLYFYR